MENSILSVKNLSKNFKTKLKNEGLKASFKSILKPEYKFIKAVDNISFNIKKGELVAFIGPNGAGKSTTIKMLSGILNLDKGEISVLNFNPQKQRKKLAYHIGTVFGQKPQLWFHLPAIDSFKLFSKIYDLDDDFYQERLNMLIKEFEIGDFINQPVRKLSLGQRMRCEFALSLLHQPKVLFLDEPTIGLDVVVKRNIRNLIKKIHEKENITVLLTSHDMGDVEKICDRAIIINHGKIIFDDELDKLKENYMSKKLIKITTENDVNFEHQNGVKVISKKQNEISCEINTNEIKLKFFIDFILKHYDVMDITINETPIEEIIEDIFNQK